MKRKLVLAVALALLLAVPAISQGDDESASLRLKVKKLEKQVADLEAFQKTVEKSMKDQAARQAELAKQLVVAEKQGYLYPAPNTDAKKAILKGLRAMSGAPAPKAKADEK